MVIGGPRHYPARDRCPSWRFPAVGNAAGDGLDRQDSVSIPSSEKMR